MHIAAPLGWGLEVYERRYQKLHFSLVASPMSFLNSSRSRGFFGGFQDQTLSLSSMLTKGLLNLHQFFRNPQSHFMFIEAKTAILEIRTNQVSLQSWINNFRSDSSPLQRFALSNSQNVLNWRTTASTANRKRLLVNRLKSVPQFQQDAELKNGYC